MSGWNKRFISEKDVEERKKAQEAEGVVEEPYDARSLYDRLQIEKDRKQEEYEQQAALKNRVHRLDEEEIEYLHSLDVKKHRVDRENEREVADLLRAAQNANSAPVVIPENTTKPPLPTRVNNGPTQRSLLASALKRPSSIPHESASQSKRQSLDSAAEVSNSDINSTQTDDQHAPPNDNPVSGEALFNLLGYSNSNSEGSDSDDSEDDSTDVEDAACSLTEIAETRVRKTKKQGHSEC